MSLLMGVLVGLSVQLPPRTLGPEWTDWKMDMGLELPARGGGAQRCPKGPAVQSAVPSLV